MKEFSIPIAQAVGCAIVIVVMIALSKTSIIPVWLAVIISIAFWWMIGSACWSNEAIRASGPRGIYWNPSGITHGNVTTLIWWTFGLFISFAHSAKRAGRRRRYR